MERFVKKIKEKVEKLEHSFTQKEQKGIEEIIAGLNKDEQEISENLKRIDYLLDLIDKHEVKASKKSQPVEMKHYNKWLSEIKASIEKMHLSGTEELSPADIEFLETEKNKLEAEKRRLERDRSYLHALIAQSDTYMMEIREDACKEASGGDGIDEVSEKLVDKFGRKFEEENVYDVGKKEIIKFLEETYSINKINAHEIFDILEKSGIVKFEIDPSSIAEYMSYDNYDDYMNMDYGPVLGTWYIKA